MDINDFDSKGMIFNKVLINCDLTQIQSECCVDFCQFLHKLKATSSEQYSKWIKFIVSAFKKKGFPEEVCKSFIHNYIEEAYFPNGEANLVCVSDNTSDINMYRKMLTVLYKNIIEPRRAKAGMLHNQKGAALEKSRRINN